MPLASNLPHWRSPRDNRLCRCKMFRRNYSRSSARGHSRAQRLALLLHFGYVPSVCGECKGAAPMDRSDFHDHHREGESNNLPDPAFVPLLVGTKQYVVVYKALGCFQPPFAIFLSSMPLHSSYDFRIWFKEKSVFFRESVLSKI